MKVLDLRSKIREMNPDLDIGFYQREVASVMYKGEHIYSIPNNLIFLYTDKEYKYITGTPHRSLMTLMTLLSNKGYLQPYQTEEIYGQA